ncbi:MAG: hypothetical protein JO103_10910 [Candidatus Eremiobacteraeota bacterium]|nr:hypothetical protein [Candidatus Eremiobacteraeota bacterium]
MLVQVICKEPIGIVAPALPVIGPAGEVTVSETESAESLRSEPVTVVVEQAKCTDWVSVGAHVIALLLIEIEAASAAVTATVNGAELVAAAAGSAHTLASAEVTAKAMSCFIEPPIASTLAQVGCQSEERKLKKVWLFV